MGSFRSPPSSLAPRPLSTRQNDGLHWIAPGLRKCRGGSSRKGQRHLSGLCWSASTGGYVGFESWLERAQVLHLDLDPSVVGIASQPFWLHWSDAAGKPVSHAPDFFARRRDGSAFVVDCRPVERRGPRDVAKFDTTARPCALAGSGRQNADRAVCCLRQGIALACQVG